jgi:segregation and condensation protein B
MKTEILKPILEAALLASDKPLNINELLKLFDGDYEVPQKADIRQALVDLMSDCEGRGVELNETASGYRYQVRLPQAQIVSRLWDERPPRYSRALLETLALIAYRQPITRAEIEDIRGVAVSSNIIATLSERDWIQVIGHKETPGRPALYATTRAFLDYFNLKTLDELPTLQAIRDLDQIVPELDLMNAEQSALQLQVVEDEAEEQISEQVERESAEMVVEETDPSSVTRH